MAGLDQPTQTTPQQQLARIASFIWRVADDVLRDVYVRGKYRDVILPMTVIRRLDAVLEPTKRDVLEMKERLDAAGIANQDACAQAGRGQSFYNTSPFTLRDLRAERVSSSCGRFRGVPRRLLPERPGHPRQVQVPQPDPHPDRGRYSRQLVEKFLDASINLSPNQPPRKARLGPALDNHAMGTIFEELIRRFNEENNEEAGEHFTPRDVVTLMANLIFLPIADRIVSGTYLVYDGACGTGGMLTVAEQTLQRLAADHGKDVGSTFSARNQRTYAISKADLLLKGEGEEAENIVGARGTRNPRHDYRDLREPVRSLRAVRRRRSGRPISFTKIDHGMLRRPSSAARLWRNPTTGVACERLCVEQAEARAIRRFRCRQPSHPRCQPPAELPPGVEAPPVHRAVPRGRREELEEALVLRNEAGARGST